jgi:hypothetical protein
MNKSKVRYYLSAEHFAGELVEVREKIKDLLVSFHVSIISLSGFTKHRLTLSFNVDSIAFVKSRLHLCYGTLISLDPLYH